MTLHLTSCRHADLPCSDLVVEELTDLFAHGDVYVARVGESARRPGKNNPTPADRLCADALRRVCGEEKG